MKGLARRSGREAPPGAAMKPPIKRFSDLKAPPPPPGTFAPPTPKVSRRKPGKVLTPAEKAAFLASRPDLKPKDSGSRLD